MSNNPEIFKNKIIDPSLLVVDEFWEDVEKKYEYMYYPSVIRNVSDDVLFYFYGSYRKDQILSLEEILNLCEKHFTPFSWRDNDEYINIIREIIPEFKINENNPIQEILLDELVFLFSKSSLLSRLKKSIKYFEKFNNIPLLNLEEKAPDEWKETVSGIKRAFTLVNYLVNIGGFTITLGFPIGSVIGVISGIFVEGVRIVIIDP